MSRSNYSDDGDYLELYRGTVERSIRGKRGQAFLQELAKAMDEMPEKRLIKNELVTETGEACAIGVVCKARNIDTKDVDIYDSETVGNLVGISRQMAAEIEYYNDEHARSDETPEQRWTRMRKRVAENLQNAGAK